MDCKRGFGFIAPSSGGDNVFVHWNAINSSDKWACLEQGQTVEYSLQHDEKRDKMVAANVSEPGGGEINLQDSEAKAMSKFTVKGTVKFFCKKGFGFITADKDISYSGEKLKAGNDVYVSREDLLMNGDADTACRVGEGQRVSFKVYKQEGKDGFAAGQVKGETGTPLEFERSERKSSKGSKGGSKGGKGGSKGGKGKTWVWVADSTPIKRTIAKTTWTPKGKGSSKGKGKKGRW